jgi:hypothetical protein
VVGRLLDLVPTAKFSGSPSCPAHDMLFVRFAYGSYCADVSTRVLF